MSTPPNGYTYSKLDFGHEDVFRAMRMPGTNLYDCAINYKNGLIPKCEFTGLNHKNVNNGNGIVNGLLLILQQDERSLVKVNIISNKDRKIDININEQKLQIDEYEEPIYVNDELDNESVINIVNSIKIAIQEDIKNNNLQDYKKYETTINEILKKYNPEKKKIHFWDYAPLVNPIGDLANNDVTKESIKNIFKKTIEENNKKYDFTLDSENDIEITKNGIRITQFYKLWEQCDNRHEQWEVIEGINTIPENFKKARHRLAENIQSAQQFYRRMNKLPKNQVTIKFGDEEPREYQTLLYAYGVIRTENKDVTIRPNAVMTTAKGVEFKGGKRKSSRKKKTRRNKKTKKSRKSRRKSNRRI